MNANLEQAIMKTLRQINSEGCGSAGGMIERLAHNFVEIEKQEKEFRIAAETGGLHEWFHRRYRKKSDA